MVLRQFKQEMQMAASLSVPAAKVLTDCSQTMQGHVTGAVGYTSHAYRCDQKATKPGASPELSTVWELMEQRAEVHYSTPSSDNTIASGWCPLPVLW